MSKLRYMNPEQWAALQPGLLEAHQDARERDRAWGEAERGRVLEHLQAFHSPEMQAAAIRTLAERGADSRLLAQLLVVLRYPATPVSNRALAARALGRCAAAVTDLPDLELALVSALEDVEAPEVRRSAAEACARLDLTTLQPPHLVTALVHRLQQDPDAEVRVQAVAALLLARGAAGVSQALRSAARRDTSPRVQADAAAVLRLPTTTPTAQPTPESVLAILLRLGARAMRSLAPVRRHGELVAGLPAEGRFDTAPRLLFVNIGSGPLTGVGDHGQWNLYESNQDESNQDRRELHLEFFGDGLEDQVIGFLLEQKTSAGLIGCFAALKPASADAGHAAARVPLDRTVFPPEKGTPLECYPVPADEVPLELMAYLLPAYEIAPGRQAWESWLQLPGPLKALQAAADQLQNEALSAAAARVLRTLRRP